MAGHCSLASKATCFRGKKGSLLLNSACCRARLLPRAPAASLQSPVEAYLDQLLAEVREDAVAAGFKARISGWGKDGGPCCVRPWYGRTCLPPHNTGRVQGPP